MNNADKKDNLANLLLLTTMGRKTGEPLISAVQYEEFRGEHCISIPRGSKADWYRNILANPWVDAQVKGKKYRALAEPVTEAARIADFLGQGLAEQSSVVASLVRTHGLPSKPTRAQLGALASNLVVIFLHQAKR